MIPIILKAKDREVTLGFCEVKDGRVEVVTLERIMLRAVCDALDKRAAEDIAEGNINLNPPKEETCEHGRPMSFGCCCTHGRADKESCPNCPPPTRG